MRKFQNVVTGSVVETNDLYMIRRLLGSLSFKEITEDWSTEEMLKREA